MGLFSDTLMIRFRSNMCGKGIFKVISESNAIRNGILALIVTFYTLILASSGSS